MRRKQTFRPRSRCSRPAHRLFLLLLAVILWIVACIVLDNLFQPMIASHGTLLFFPEG